MIKEHIAEHNIAPTWNEIADRLDIQNTSVARSVKALRDKGYITITPGKYRGIELTNMIEVDSRDVLKESRRILFAASDLRDAALLSQTSGTISITAVKKQVDEITSCINKLSSLLSIGKESDVRELKPCA